MADTDWTNDELASLDRIPRYNVLDPANGGDAYSFGGDGYLDNQMRQQVDGLVVAKAVRRFSLFALAQALFAKQESDDATAERIAAQNASSTAYKWANAPEDQEVEPGKFSALHFMRKAMAEVAKAAEKVVDAAAEVTKAATQADRSKTEADRSQSYAAGLNIPALNSSTALQYLRANAAGSAYEFAAVDLYSASLINRIDRTGNDALSKAYKGVFIDFTSGTFIQTFPTAASLGAGWFIYLRNSGLGDITLMANGTTIDGLASFVMYPGEVRLIQCDGVRLRSLVLEAGTKTFNASGTLIWPPGVNGAIVDAFGGGGGGSRTANANTSYGGAGGGGGGRTTEIVSSQPAGQSISASVGSGGSGATTSAANGGDGGDSILGSLVCARGGTGGSNNGATGGSGGAAGFQNITVAGGASGSYGSSFQTNTPLFADKGGGAGGGNTSAVAGGSSSYGASGGGGGGAGSASGGANGGSSGTAGPLTGLPGGQSGNSTTDGAGGLNGQNGTDGRAGQGGAGGGGAATNTGGRLGGKGGDGGFPGGGGGGGGSANISGNGGNGGAGRIIVRFF